MNEYVIWSEEHSAWWAPNQNGYTRWLKQAGRYSLAEAQEIVFRANQYLGKDVLNEVYLPDPLLPD